MLIDCLVNLIRGKGSVNFDNPVYQPQYIENQPQYIEKRRYHPRPVEDDFVSALHGSGRPRLKDAADVEAVSLKFDAQLSVGVIL